MKLARPGKTAGRRTRTAMPNVARTIETPSKKADRISATSNTDRRREAGIRRPSGGISQPGLKVMHGLRAWRAFILLSACAHLLPASSRVLYRPAAGNRPPQISIKGEIVQADLEAFTAIAETARQEAVTFMASRGTSTPPPGMEFVNVALDSRGGNIWAAMSIGRIIRRYSFATRVEVGASCVSACVYLLAAGQGRYVGGRVGVHRPHLQNDGVTSARAEKAQYASINAQTRQYLEEMNLPTSLHVRMMQTPSDRVTWLSAQDLSTYGLTRMIPPSPRPAVP